MKFVGVLLMLVGLSCYAVAKDTKELLTKSVEAALESKKPKNLIQLYDFSGVDKKRKDMELLRWSLAFAHDFNAERNFIKRVIWKPIGKLPKRNLVKISSIAILGAILVEGESYHNGGMIPYKYELFVGKSKKGQWHLIVVDIESTEVHEK